MQHVKHLMSNYAERIIGAFTRGHERLVNEFGDVDFTLRTRRTMAHDLIFGELVREFEGDPSAEIETVNQLRMLRLPNLRLRLHYTKNMRRSVNTTQQTRAFAEQLMPGITTLSAVLFYEENRLGDLEAVCVGRDPGTGSIRDYFELSELVAVNDHETADAAAEDEMLEEATPERRKRFSIVGRPATEQAATEQGE